MGRRFHAVEALLACLSGRMHPLHPERWAAADWEALVGLAERREVAPLLYHCLQGADPRPEIPARSRQRLEVLYARNALRNRKLYAELSTILAALQGQGIEVILLKGAGLAAEVYGDAALRVMGDLDLMVAREDLARTQQLLVELGYAPAAACPLEEACQRSHHLPPLLKAGATPVEVHWTPELPRGGLALDLAGIWARSRVVSVAGQRARWLGAVDLVIHLCIHAAYHHRWGAELDREFALRPLCDISRSLTRYAPELEWEQLVSVANRAGVGRYVASALCLAQRMLGAELPAGVLERLEHTDADVEMVATVEALLTTDATLPFSPGYRNWARSQGARQQLEVLARVLFPARRRLREMYPLAPHSWWGDVFYLVRPFDLLWRRGRMLLNLSLALPAGRAIRAQERRRRQVAAWVGPRPAEHPEPQPPERGGEDAGPRGRAEPRELASCSIGRAGNSSA